MASPLVIHASGPNYDGFVVIDSVANGTSAGGVRIAPDLALQEIQDLAREMTLKFSLFRLPRGGAKAGLRLAEDLTPEIRRETLVGFGRQIGPLVRVGLYSPGMDMNCGPEEIRTIYAGAGISVGNPTDSSFFTAVGVGCALQGSMEALGGPEPITVAIEGFGSVGQHLSALLPPSRFRIIAISTVRGAIRNPSGFPPEELRRMRKEHGDRLVEQLPGTRISHEDLLTLATDVLVPAARTGGITLEIAGRIQARAVIPAANCPYAPGAAGRLHERGILCLPGYLCNAGGVLGSSLADSGIATAAIESLFQSRYRPLIKNLVQSCLRQGLSPVPIVDSLALRQAGIRYHTVPSISLSEKLAKRVVRRLPRSLKKRAAWRRCGEAFDAMESDFAQVGA